jgi:UDP-N-acetyl-alpha-D-muramoyl-L-alanyl-L-glutamate epimerase
MLLTDRQSSLSLSPVDLPQIAGQTLSPQPPLTMAIKSLEVYQHHLEIGYQLGECCFTTKVFYYDVDLNELADRYSQQFMRQVYCHTALVEGLKFCSAFPEVYDVTAIADGLSADSLEFFTRTYNAAYTQNKYENQISNYNGPLLTFEGELGTLKPMTLSGNNPAVLTGNGGGKDSFLSMKVLEEAGIPFAAFQWARSEYGRFEYQHDLSSKIYQHVQPQKVHRVSIHDDFTDGVYMQLYFPHLQAPFTLGTPECIFAAMPILLDQEYCYLSFGNEKSSDTGNFYWEELGEEVNHQWIKTYEAECIFEAFVREHFITNHQYFSLLKPIYDYRIFKNLARYPDALPVLHSCNIDKPWCKKCAKCAYVWLNYLANFDTQVINDLFHSNPFDAAELHLFYRQMLGLEEHNAFECVGNIQESRIAMQRCAQKGLTGQVIAMFQTDVQSQVLKEWDELEQKYDRIYPEHNIPAHIFDRVKPYL